MAPNGTFLHTTFYCTCPTILNTKKTQGWKGNSTKLPDKASTQSQTLQLTSSCCTSKWNIKCSKNTLKENLKRFLCLTQTSKNWLGFYLIFLLLVISSYCFVFCFFLLLVNFLPSWDKFSQYVWHVLLVKLSKEISKNVRKVLTLTFFVRSIVIVNCLKAIKSI